MQVAVIGAGIAGLTLAEKLSENGIKTVLIEREKTVGGLARSFRYDNGSVFDIGPHRFHTEDPVVNQFIMETLGDNHVVIDRNSQLFLFNKYLPWPLTPKGLLSLPLHLFIRSGIDLFIKHKARNDSFEDYIIEKYGNTLYSVFFKPYTEKFMNYNCSNLHKDWATTGINRATIDKKVDTGSLISLIKSVLFAHDANTKFIYPKIGGIGTFSEILAAKIENHGGRILLDAQIDRLETNEQKITTVITNEGEQIPVEHVFWSGSLMSLRSIGKAPEMVPRLHYMSSIFFNYLTSENIKQGFQWCYFGDKDATVDRISVPRNFNSALIPQGKEGLCVEVSCQENSHEWKDPARFDCVLETFLLKSDLISSLNQIDEYHVEHVHDTYPMYVLNYPRKLKTIFDWVNTTWSNMTLIGRTGRFWYNNMDNSIAAALKTSKMFIRDFQKGDLQHGDTYSAEDRYLEK